MRYVLLIKWIDRGLQAAEVSQNVLPAAKQAFKEANGEFVELVHCVGEIDLVAIVTAPSALEVTAFTLALGGVGKVRTVTLQAFDEEEMGQVVQKARSIRDGYIRGGGAVTPG
jgi:uncharacterized protein with GYD domain